MRWTHAEDECLRRAVAEKGAKQWKVIASTYLKGTRTDVQCLHRWQKVGSAVVLLHDAGCWHECGRANAAGL